jgi:O-antigen/teichoic acid export membrane protein
MINKYIHSDFIKNFSYLFGSSILSQAIPFVTLPILQKYFFTPEEFGLYTLYITISELLIGISTLKYEYAILADKRIKYAVNTCFLSIFIAIVISIIVFVVVFIIYQYSEANKLNEYILLVPVSVVSMAIYESINYWLNKNKEYLKIGMLKLSNLAATESSKLSLGYFQLTANGLIIGKLTGQIISMFIGIYLFYKNYKKYIKFYNRKIIVHQFKKHKKFPLYTAPGVIITGAVNYIYIKLFYDYFGPEKVGIIGISTSYIAAAFALVSASFAQIFYQKISETSDLKKIKKMYIHYSKILALFSLLILTIIIFTPVNWITYVLGDKWNDLLPVMQIMCLWLSVSFITSSLSFIYIRLNKQKTMFLLETLHLLIVIFTISVSYKIYNDFKISLLSFSIAQILYYISVYIISLSFMRDKS